MKLYAITIKPESPFGTSLKGDTVFGHFCWQAANDPGLLSGGLDHWIDCYPERPFAIFSSAFPKFIENGIEYFCLKRPDLPLDILFEKRTEESSCFERLKARKENKKRRWMLVRKDLKLSFEESSFINDRELFARNWKALPDLTRQETRRSSSRSLIVTCNQAHNTINRLTQTTGEGFAPYVMQNTFFFPGTELSIFVLVEPEALGIEEIRTGLERIGQCGFGRDASTGLGRFSLGEDQELQLPDKDKATACYTLGPCVPEKDSYERIFFTPFTRFGKHGEMLAVSRNPFKNPVVMADEGAVLISKGRELFEKPYVGTAVKGISKVMPRAVTQGYSIYLPCRVEV